MFVSVYSAKLPSSRENKSIHSANSKTQSLNSHSRLLKVLEKRCTKCLSTIGRGLPHNCTLGTRHKNLRKIAVADPVRAEQVASAVLASKSASPNGTIRLSQLIGKM